MQLTRNRKNIANAVLVIATSLLLTACGGTKVLKEPAPLERSHPLAAATEDSIEATLDWVVVRDGPGTWARNADWDEYRIRIANNGTSPIQVQRVVVSDLMGEQAMSNDSRRGLVRGSKQVARRYDDHAIEIQAGLGTATLMAAGVTSFGLAAGVALGGGVMGASAGAGLVAAGALLAAPVLVTGGVLKGVNASKVTREIRERATSIPVDVAPGDVQPVTAFFPLTPSPTQVEIIYTDAGAEKTLVIDTTGILDGLHIADAGPKRKTVPYGQSRWAHRQE